MAGDAFTRDKLLWLDQVAEDVRISAGAFRLAYILASRFLSRESGTAFPSQETLGGLLQLTDRHVLRLTRELVGAGYLAVRRGGRSRSNRYSLVRHEGTYLSGHAGGAGQPRPDENVPLTL